MLSHDKKQHFIAGLTISFVGGMVWPPLVLLGFLAGAVKEFYDIHYEGTPEWMDFVWTCAGAAVGTVIVIVTQGIQW